MIDYYAVLGIDRKADAERIKKAFRALAVTLHPDKTGGDVAAEEKMKLANLAYKTLKDEEKRRLYDKQLATTQRQQQPAGSGSAWKQSTAPKTATDDFADFVQQMRRDNEAFERRMAAHERFRELILIGGTAAIIGIALWTMFQLEKQETTVARPSVDKSRPMIRPEDDPNKGKTFIYQPK